VGRRIEKKELGRTREKYLPDPSLGLGKRLLEM
jgi:hypothetical protein